MCNVCLVPHESQTPMLSPGLNSMFPPHILHLNPAKIFTPLSFQVLFSNLMQEPFYSGFLHA